MNRTRRFVGGVVFGYAQQVFVTLTGLWLTPFLLRRIGQRDYGLWLLGFQILTYLTLMDFGIVALLPRETAYALGRAGTVEKASDLPAIVGRTARVVLYQIPVVTLVAIVLWIFIPAEWHELKGPIGLVEIVFVVTFPLRIFRAILEGLQELAFLGKISIFSWGAGTAATIALVISGFHLYALAAGWGITQLSLATASFMRLRLKYPGALPSRLPAMPKRELFENLRRGFWVSLAQLAQVLLNGTDLLVIGRTLGATAVVPYSCTGKLIGVLSNQPQVLMQSAAPGLSAIKSSGERGRASQVSSNLTQLMLIVSGAVATTVVAINQGFVSWWVGSRQYGGFTLTVLIAVAMLLRHWNTTTVYSIFCFGYERRISVTTLIDGAVTVSSAIFFVHRFGAIGAPLGSIVGVSLVSLPSNLFALCRETEVPLSRSILPLRPWFWRFSIVGLGAVVIARTWTPTNPFELAIEAVCLAGAYAIVMLPMIMRSTLRNYVPASFTRAWGRIGSRRSAIASAA